MAKLRLLKVRVQPVFAFDDGETLHPVMYPGPDGQPTENHAVIDIPAAEWPTYSGERFPAETKAWERQLNAEIAAASPNRAARRAKKPKE